MAQQQALLPQFIYQPAPYTMAPDFEAGFNSSGNEYHGSLPQDQYENMYRKWERIAEGCINNGISGESSPTAASLQNKQTLLDAQKQMKRIRSEAAQNGVYIQQSRWETATGGY